VIPAVRVARGRFRARQAVVAKLQQGPGAARLELELDRARTRRHRVLLAALGLPAERVDEPTRRVELDELAARDMAADHIDAVLAAGTRVDPGLTAEPARQLLRVDEELPDCFRAGVDRELPLDRRLSRRFHASSPPFLPHA